VTLAEIETALMELIAWRQQEQARLRTPVPPPVSTVDGYRGLWDLRTELGRALAAEHDPAARLPLQASRAEVDSAIAAAKADPTLAAQIRAWWLARYTEDR
jgi:hypothetical protein